MPKWANGRTILALVGGLSAPERKNAAPTQLPVSPEAQAVSSSGLMLPDGLVIEDRRSVPNGRCPRSFRSLGWRPPRQARASNLPKLQGCPPRSRRQRFADLQARRTAGYRRWRVSAVARFSIAYRRPAFFVEPLNRSFIRICYEPRRGWGLADGRFRSGRADHPGHDDPALAGADVPAVTPTRESLRARRALPRPHRR
jgi:hypothetical protein